MISTNNISKQFASSPLFEEINITFNKGNRYGLIGANGSGKSTFMKILSGEIESTSGTIKIESNKRVATLKQNQFAFEQIKITDCVIMGYKKLWDVKIERERIYSLDEMSEEESLKVANLEIEFSDNYFVGGIELKEDNTALILFAGKTNVEKVFTVTEGRVEAILESTVSGSDAEVQSVTHELPGSFLVKDAYPNPFNPSTTISVELNKTADLSVRVYNLMGQLVDVIAEGSYSPDTYNLTWNAENLASGVYLVKTQVGSDVSTQKVMLLK